MAGEPAVSRATPGRNIDGRWKCGLPELRDPAVTLRELRRRDAPSLLHHVNDAAVLRFIAQCPPTVARFERFIQWTRTERRCGRHACYGIVPRGQTLAVGIIQVWPVERGFSTCEWGFAIGAACWGTGLFGRAAHLFLDAVFIDRIFGPVHRLEARAVIDNRRGNGFLRRMGATCEGVLRGGFREGDYIADQYMWSMLSPEWTGREAASRRRG